MEKYTRSSPRSIWGAWTRTKKRIFRSSVQGTNSTRQSSANEVQARQGQLPPCSASCWPMVHTLFATRTDWLNLCWLQLAGFGLKSFLSVGQSESMQSSEARMRICRPKMARSERSELMRSVKGTVRILVPSAWTKMPGSSAETSDERDTAPRTRRHEKASLEAILEMFEERKL